MPLVGETKGAGFVKKSGAHKPLHKSQFLAKLPQGNVPMALRILGTRQK
jgi:hypothetical protein